MDIVLKVEMNLVIKEIHDLGDVDTSLLNNGADLWPLNTLYEPFQIHLLSCWRGISWIILWIDDSLN